MLKVGTVCSGIGSPEFALNELNVPHKRVFACEIDKYAQKSYLANFSVDNMFSDMTKDDWKEHYVDLLVGGIPCQSFSLAGKRLGELDPRGLLFYDFYDYVKKQQPKYFIIENVKGLLSTENVFNTWLELLGQSVNTHYNMFNHEDSLLYNLHWTVLNSKDFGVPQNRERVFIVGIRNDLQNTFRFPAGFPLTKRLKDVLEPVVDEKYYLSDKMLDYMNSRSANFNNGKINYKVGEDVASNKSLDISDNIIVEGEVTPNSQAGKIYSNEGIFPTLTAGTHGYALGYTREPEWTIEQKNTWKYEKTCDCGHVSIGTLKEVCPGCNAFQCGFTNEIDQKTLKRIVNEPAILIPKRTEFGKQTRKDYEAGKLKLQRKEINELAPRTDGISNTITSVQKDNLLFEPFCVAMRGRNPLNPSDRTTGADTEQRLEPNSQGVTNTITSVQKDNLIITNELIKVGSLYEDNNDAGGIYSDEGISTTIKSEGGGLGAKTGLYTTKNRIRRLTPLECFRLQAFSDDFFYKAKQANVSDSQLYKQAGNSITTFVIKAVLHNLLK